MTPDETEWIRHLFIVELERLACLSGNKDGDEVHSSFKRAKLLFELALVWQEDVEPV